MLAARHRLRASAMFGAVMRGGQRGSSPTVVVHLLRREADMPTQVGFAVSKAVGNAVVRHQVTRRLRAIMAGRLAHLPQGSAVVVRALPPAATASSTELASNVDQAIARAQR